LSFESKSRETKKKIARRSRAIFLASTLFGTSAFVTLRMDSVAADSATLNGPRKKNANTSDTTTTAANTADANAAPSSGNATRGADAPDKPAGDSIGTIEGDAIALQGPMNVEVVRGQVKTMLRSGNDIRVKSGQARIDLVEGGTIAICGPAHLSLLKSGGALTIAIDSGIVHVHVGKTPSLTLYTAQVQAKPIAIGDDDQDALIGFDAAGVMCVRAGGGAIRIEQQLSGKSMIVPQGGEILVDNGGIEGITNTSGHCECELQGGNETPPQPELSRMATPDEIRQRDAAKVAEAAAVKEAADNAAMDKAAAEKEAADRAAAQRAAQEKAASDKLEADAAAAKSAAAQAAAARAAAAQAAAAQPTVVASTSAQNNAKPPVPWGENASPPVEQKVAKPEMPKAQEPIYQVFMPPLSYNAKATAPADNFDPKFIMLVRRVRVKPTLIYQGKVEGETPAAKTVSDVNPSGTTAKGGPTPPPNGSGAPKPGAQQNAKPGPPPDTSVVNRVRNYIRHLFS
jgi:hypothetical protein